ncbi:MAG: hypothetical protein ACYTFI_02715 [Planctomycetota bacterium]
MARIRRILLRRSPRPGRTCLALVTALAASTSALSAEGPADGKVVRFALNNRQIEGVIVDRDEKGFTLRMGGRGSKTEIRLRWSDLSPSDARRLRGGGKTGGPKERPSEGIDLVAATRYRLKSGRSLVGAEVKEKSTADEIVLRTSRIREFRIPRKSVERTESVTVPETEIYTRDEIYVRKKAELDPREDASRHFKLAQYMAKIGHRAKAKEHFQRAAIHDERYKERAEQKIAEMEGALVGTETRRLDQRIAADVRAGRLLEAVRRIRTLGAVAPKSFVRTKWEAQLPGILDKLRKSLRRSVVGSYYARMDDLIGKWVRGQIPVGGAIPGVRVTVKGRESVTGKLVKQSSQLLVIESGGRRIEIAGSIVTDVTPVDLNTKRAAPGFAESKRYVEDATGGVTADILRWLEAQYKEFGTPKSPVDQKLIEEFWKERLVRVTEWGGRGKRQDIPASSRREANYGTGTWLREGTPTAGRPRTRGGSRGTDPEKWWASQPHEARYQVLKALAAEALCEVDKVIKTRCSGCGGRGGTASVRRGAGARVCAACRGTGYFIKIRYR